MGYYYRIMIAGKELHYLFHYLETSRYFQNSIEEAPKDNAICVKENDFNLWEEKWKYNACAPTEMAILPYRTSDYLLKDHRCVYHDNGSKWNREKHTIKKLDETIWE